MRWLLLGAAAGATFGSAALAQRKPMPEKKEIPAPEPAFEINGKTAVLQGLDKVTARITPLEAQVGQALRFGSLEIVVRRCQRSRPDQKPERAAFAEIFDIDPATREKRRVFSGWLFATNPALSALDHPVYDVWVKDCR